MLGKSLSRGAFSSRFRQNLLCNSPTRKPGLVFAQTRGRSPGHLWPRLVARGWPRGPEALGPSCEVRAAPPPAGRRSAIRMPRPTLSSRAVCQGDLLPSVRKMTSPRMRWKCGITRREDVSAEWFSSWSLSGQFGALAGKAAPRGRARGSV